MILLYNWHKLILLHIHFLQLHIKISIGHHCWDQSPDNSSSSSSTLAWCLVPRSLSGFWVTTGSWMDAGGSWIEGVRDAARVCRAVLVVAFVFALAVLALGPVFLAAAAFVALGVLEGPAVGCPYSSSESMSLRYWFQLLDLNKPISKTHLPSLPLRFLCTGPYFLSRWTTELLNWILSAACSLKISTLGGLAVWGRRLLASRSWCWSRSRSIVLM